MDALWRAFWVSSSISYLRVALYFRRGQVFTRVRGWHFGCRTGDNSAGNPPTRSFASDRFLHRSVVTLAAAAFLFAFQSKLTGDDFAYAEFSGGGLFGVIDLTNGQFTPRGDFQGQCCVGLAQSGSNLYGIGGPSDSGNYTILYQINPANGNLTTIGSGSHSFNVFGSTNAGMFGIGYDMNLYSVDPSTGTSTLVGATGLALPTHDGLSAGSTTLYFTAQYGSSTPSLYSINTVTGAAALIGSTPAIYAPVYVSGQLYATTLPPISIYTVNTATAANTYVSTLSPTSTVIIDAMAPAGSTNCPNAAISITQVLPSSGGNAGQVSTTIIGCGIQNGAAVKLTGIGADIAASNVAVNSGQNSSMLTATFNFAGVSPGARNIVITNPDGTSVTLVNAFTVQQGGAPQLWAQLLGFDKIRVGVAQAYYVTYGNFGSTDALGTRLVVYFPSSVAPNITFGNSNGVVSSVTQGSSTVATVNVGRVPAGSTFFIPITMTAGGNQAPFQITVNISGH